MDIMNKHPRKVITGLWLLLGLVSLAALMVFGPPQASASYDIGPIADVLPSHSTGDEIDLMEADGQNDRPATVAPSADPGVIAYVNRSTHDIHLISPDGTNDRVLWTAPEPLSPYSAYDLAWRPDGRELAFSSEHEFACSWYESDVYTIGYDRTGYRRVTNSPACAALAALSRGSVEVEVHNYVGPWVSVYVQGAPGLKYANSSRVRFDNVADFGPGVLQPAVGINGDQRTQANPPLADVVPGATVAGGILTIISITRGTT